MPELGPPMFWRLGLQSTLQADSANAKEALNDIEVSGDKATGSLNILDQATGKNARGIQSMGTVAMMAGGSLMMMSSTMKDANGNINELGQTVQTAGAILTGFGMISAVLPPIIRSIGFVHTAIIPEIMANTTATAGNTIAIEAETATIEENLTVKAAEIPLSETITTVNQQVSASYFENASVGDLATLATIQLTTAKSELIPVLVAENAAEADATLAIGAMGTAEAEATGTTMGLSGAVSILAGASVIGALIVGAYLLYSATNNAKKAEEDQKKALEASKKAMDDLITSTNELQSLRDKIAGIPKTEEDMNLKLRSDQLALRRAQLNLAQPGLTGIDKDTAQLALDEAQSRVKNDFADLAAFQTQKETWKTQEEATSRTQGMASLQAHANYSVPTKWGLADAASATINWLTPQPGGVASGVSNTVPSGTVIQQIGPIYGNFNGESIMVKGGSATISRSDLIARGLL